MSSQLAVSEQSISIQNGKNIPVKPFLRWAGGKRQLVNALVDHLPNDLSTRRYVEPFLGAGSLFFASQPGKALIGDANQRLIHTYCAIRDDPEGVRSHLQALLSVHNSESYYKVRVEYNCSSFSIVQAARFLYLNKTCFNGIYRVNAKGAFNVPIGKKDRILLPTAAEFAKIAEILIGAEICCCDYKEILSLANPSDFVYLDPPYPALNDTAYFNHYTADRFDSKAQSALADQVKILHNKGAHFLMSNADVPSVRELYSGFTMTSIAVRRYITCKSKRLEVAELLIKNY